MLFVLLRGISPTISWVLYYFALWVLSSFDLWCFNKFSSSKPAAASCLLLSTPVTLSWCTVSTQQTMDDNEWIQISLSAQSCSHNFRNKLLTFANETKYNALRNVIPCWRCNTQKGTYLHMLWSCEGWQNSGKEYYFISERHRLSLLPGFVFLEMLILETVIRRHCET
jgi:hypothetical protein